MANASLNGARIAGIVLIIGGFAPYNCGYFNEIIAINQK
tara:strand:+ start:1836 stop:1952 length:117 start_codon:yes stop_codon:yes gene_type:complete